MRLEDLLRAAGPLRPAYQRVDWAATPLGPVASWSPTLASTVELVLATRFPVTLLWGPRYAMVYNAAYVQLIVQKHPAALGASAADVFPEAWHAIGPLMRHVRAGRGATWVEEAAVPLERHGFLEEAYFTFSYSPVRGEDGVIEGVLDIATETTRQVLDRRRLRLLGLLAEQLGDLDRAGELADRALPLLAAETEDLPAVDVRLDGRRDERADPRLPAAPPRPLHAGELLLEETPTGRVAWMPLDPVRADRGGPVLVIALSERLAPDEDYLEFLRLIASALSQALDRVRTREAERAAAAAEHDLAAALQRNLLTMPPRLAQGLDVAVRYRPAAREAEVGGDWYDAFTLPGGALMLVIGDVTGHDLVAAAAMAQIRNLLRGIAHTLHGSPAEMLGALDRAMRGLDVGMVATGIMAGVPQAAAGTPRTVRFSNAGHPPPVLVGPDGAARLVQTPPDLLLGLAEDARTEHEVVVAPGGRLILYTDGLVERRDTPLPERLDWLVGVCEGAHALSADEVCDRLIAHLGDGEDDDVALLVLGVQDA